MFSLSVGKNKCIELIQVEEKNSIEIKRGTHNLCFQESDDHQEREKKENHDAAEGRNRGQNRLRLKCKRGRDREL